MIASITLYFSSHSRQLMSIADCSKNLRGFTISWMSRASSGDFPFAMLECGISVNLQNGHVCQRPDKYDVINRGKIPLSRISYCSSGYRLWLNVNDMSGLDSAQRITLSRWSENPTWAKGLIGLSSHFSAESSLSGFFTIIYNAIVEKKSMKRETHYNDATSDIFVIFC